MKRVVNILLLSLCTLISFAQTLSLESCIDLAKTNSAAADNSEIDVAIAQETKRQMMTKYFPQIQGFAFGYYSVNPLIELGIDDISNTSVRDVLNVLYNNYGSALGIDKSVSFLQHGSMVGIMALQPIFMGGKIYNANKLAEVGLEASREQSAIDLRELEANVEDAFWLVYALENKQRVLEQAQATIESVSADVNHAVQAGLAIQNDKLQIEIQQNEIISRRLSVESGIRLAKWALCQTIGIEMTDSFNIQHDNYSFDLPPQFIETDAAYNRPEYRLLQLNLEAEKYKKLLNIGDAMPNLMVGAGYSYNNLLDKNANNGTVFFTATVPISAWWETSSKIKQSNLEIKKAENMRRDYYEKMAIQTRQAWNELTETYRQLTIAQRTVDNAQENMRISQLNYNAGLITLSEFLQAQTIYFQAMDNLYDKQNSFVVRRHNYLRINASN